MKMKITKFLSCFYIFLIFSFTLQSKLKNKNKRDEFIDKLFKIIINLLNDKSTFSVTENEINNQLKQIKQVSNISLENKIKSRLFNFPIFKSKEVTKYEVLDQIKSYLKSNLPNSSDEIYNSMLKILDLADSNKTILALMNVNSDSNVIEEIDSITSSYVKQNANQLLVNKSPHFKEIDLDANSAEYKSEKSSKSPPAPNSPQAGSICSGYSDCQLKKLLWMACVLIATTIRVAYEMMNIVIKMIAFVIYNLCACVGAPTKDEIKIKCNNTSGQPGLICTIPNMVFKVIFKITVFIWKAFVMLHNFCMNPIYPI